MKRRVSAILRERDFIERHPSLTPAFRAGALAALDKELEGLQVTLDGFAPAVTRTGGQPPDPQKVDPPKK